MNSFRVKTEYEPKRCEICHKNDLFDGSSNFCLRCKESQITQTDTKVVNLENDSSVLSITEKDSYKNDYDQVSTYLLIFSLLFTILALFAIDDYNINNLVGLSFNLVVLGLLFSGIIIATYLNNKIYGKTLLKMLLATILPIFCLLVFCLVQFISHLGIC